MRIVPIRPAKVTPAVVNMASTKGMHCRTFKCVPSKRGHSAGCRAGMVKRCADFTG